MSKLCNRCGGTGLEPENDIPFVSPEQGKAANIYQDLLTGPFGRVLDHNLEDKDNGQ